MKLWPWLVVVFALRAGAQPAMESVQANLNLLRRSPSGVEYGDDKPDKFTNKWLKLKGYKPVTCFGGDLCMEERYGLVSVDGEDILHADFTSVEIFYGQIFLSHLDWAALVDENLKVIKPFPRA